MSEELANQCANHISFAPASIESPSLFRFEANGVPAAAAYEIKFLLAEEQARDVEARLSARLSLDSHADPSLGRAYQTTSLYTDTPDYAVFRRMGEHGKTKFRVRRYGSSGPVFLERKDKDGDRVHKSRVSASTTELTEFSAGRASAQGAGGWFRDEIARRRLSPVCRISYDRVAYLGTAETGAVRATFDRKVRGEATTQWEAAPVRTTTELLPGQVICEFKYRLAVPQLFKEIIATLGLHPTPCSKYRRFIASIGIAGPGDDVASGDAANG